MHYAIADVAAFVAPGGALDREAFDAGRDAVPPRRSRAALPRRARRGRREPAPRRRPAGAALDLRPRRRGAPGHDDAASAPPCAAAPRSRTPRCRPRSTPATASPSLALLRDLGEHLLDRERERGGVSIAAPGQEVVRDADGSYSLELEAPLPVETWNAQISLLTGREAARLMVDGGVGLVRTLPPPDDGIVGRLRHTARALGVDVARRARRTPTSCAGSGPTTRRRAPPSCSRRSTRSAARATRWSPPTRRHADPRRGGRAVRARDRAAATPRRSLRQRGRARGRRRVPAAGVGGRRAARARRRDAASRSPRGRGRPGVHRRGRDGGARRLDRLRRSRPRWSTVTAEASSCCSPTCPSSPPSPATADRSASR